jgi:hypothetical protein
VFHGSWLIDILRLAPFRLILTVGHIRACSESPLPLP